MTQEAIVDSEVRGRGIPGVETTVLVIEHPMLKQIDMDRLNHLAFMADLGGGSDYHRSNADS